MSRRRRTSSITGLIILGAIILFVVMNTNPGLVQSVTKNIPNWNRYLPDLSQYIPDASKYIPDLSKYLPTQFPSSQPAPGNPTSGFPSLANKPALREITYKGCPPEGDGSDADLNRHKNRVDEASQYSAVSLETLINLPYPDSIARKKRENWSAADTSATAQYEGTPVSVEAYLEGSKVEGPEATNCHSTEDVDFHIWLVAGPNADRTRALVVEVTPRVHANHPGWTNAKLQRLDSTHPLVRVSGWVMMDQEHPEQLNNTRGTLWEIHPIMQLEVQEGGQWVALDKVP